MFRLPKIVSFRVGAIVISMATLVFVSVMYIDEFIELRTLSHSLSHVPTTIDADQVPTTEDPEHGPMQSSRIEQAFKLEPGKKLTRQEMARLALKDNHNLPYDVLVEASPLERADTNGAVARKVVGTNQANCTHVPPTLNDIHVSNGYYQVFMHRNITMWLYSAHVDNRPRENDVIRVFLTLESWSKMFKSKEWQEAREDTGLICRVWYMNEGKVEKVTEVKAKDFNYTTPFRGRFYDSQLHSALFNCPIPKSTTDLQPTFVTITNNVTGCNVNTNALDLRRSVSPKRNKSRLALCVQTMLYVNFDISLRLVEWLELLKTLKYDKVFLYEIDAPPNITKVLNHYQAQGFVEVIPQPFPGYFPHGNNMYHTQMVRDSMDGRAYMPLQHPGRKDCFYRNMYNFDYIAIFDIDEIIVPKSNVDMPTLLDSMQPPDDPADAFMFWGAYFPRYQKDPSESIDVDGHAINYTEALYMNFNVFKNGTCGGQVKSVYSTKRVSGFYAHAIDNYEGCIDYTKCKKLYVPKKYAEVNHYRSACKYESKSPIVRDESVRKYKDIPTKVANALEQIFL